MSDSPTLKNEPTEALQRTRIHGCFTAIALAATTVIIAMAGIIWLATVNPAVIPGDVLAQDLGRGVGFAAILFLIGLPALLILRQPTMRLWRGMGLVLTVTGVLMLIQGLVLTLDRGILEFPGLPYLVPAGINILFALLLVGLKPSRYLRAPNVTSLFWGLFFGALLGIGWVFVGVLGTPLEFFLSLIEAVGLALVVAVLMPLLFTYDPNFSKEWPRWSIVIISVLIFSLLPALLAVRGFMVQGGLVFPGLLLAGWVYGGLAILHPQPDPAKQWPALFAFMLIALVVPFIFTEGLEGDWMLTSLGSIWSVATGIAAGVGILLSIVMLALYGPLSKMQSPLIPGVLALIALIAIPVAYVATGGRGFMSDAFFVVMEDQADTSFAADIEDRDERVEAVHETLVEHAFETQADLRDFLDERDATYTPYYLVNGFEVQGGRALRAAILRQPGVDRIIESPPTRPFPSLFPTKTQDLSASVDDLAQIPTPDLFFAPFGTVTWGLTVMEVPEVWEEFGVEGEGIIIGNADSGVDWQHPDLTDNYLGIDGDHDYHWFDPWEGTTEPTDTGGHGTHTAGTSFGASGIGVAPGADWIACRNLARNLGNPAVYLDCMQFLFAPFPLDGDPFEDGDPTRGAHVTNNSWGCPPEEGCDGETMGVAAAHLRNAGQMMIVSAGNEGPGCETIGIPATNEDVLSVGAIDRSMSITFFSSRGPTEDYTGDAIVKPDVVAPGQDVYSATIGGGYAPSAGTSMAGPHVAGVVALMWSANPELIGNIELTEFIIYETADAERLNTVNVAGLCGEPEGDQDNIFGYGVVNAFAAVEEAIEVQ